MVDSEVQRKRLLDLVTRWADHTKVTPYLRGHDIPGLVCQILDEFYHITLSCGHLVDSMDECVSLELKETDGVYYGSYCKDCAERYVAEGFAKRV